MSKEQIIPDLLPVNLAGETKFVKRGEYAKHTAETFALKFKAEIKKQHVVDMLEAYEKGKRELDPDVPDEITKLWEQVQEDYQSAVAEVERLTQEEADKKAAAEREAKEKEEKEVALFQSVNGKVASLGDLAKQFDTGDNMDRFVARKGAKDSELLVALSTGLKMGDFTNWMMGDLVVELENRGQLGVVMKMAEAYGKPYVNIYNAAKTARNVPPEKRSKGVSYTVYAEIANAKFTKDGDEKYHEKTMATLVDRASKGEFTAQTARAAKLAAQGKSSTPTTILPEEDKKAEFIVIDHDGESVQITVGFPAEKSTDCTIVHLKTGKMFTTMRNAADKRWTDLPIYKKPSEEKKVSPKQAAAQPGVGNQLKPSKKKK